MYGFGMLISSLKKSCKLINTYLDPFFENWNLLLACQYTGEMFSFLCGRGGLR